MSKNINLFGQDFSNVPALNVPLQGGGTAKFTDISDTDAAATDVASGKYFYTADGTKTEGTASGGGGLSLLASAEFNVSTTSSSQTDINNINVPELLTGIRNTPLAIICRDKAGKRDGYFYESVRFVTINDLGSGNLSGTTFVYTMKNNYISAYTGNVGVFASQYDSYTNGTITISAKYNSTTSGTIDGTYICEVYGIEYPNGTNPWT